jgi:hypothetical protein
MAPWLREAFGDLRVEVHEAFRRNPDTYPEP